MELGNVIFGNSRGAYEADRGRFETIFGPLMYMLSDLNYEYENNIFVSRPYYWGNCECGFEEKEFKWNEKYKHLYHSNRKEEYEERHQEFLLENPGHSEDCPIVLPNFVYKPIEFKIEWYKYPFRDSYCNKKLDDGDLIDIVCTCIQSMKKRI